MLFINMNNPGGVCRLCPLRRRPSALCLACLKKNYLFVLVLVVLLLMVAGLGWVLSCWVLGGWSCGCLACCRGCLWCLACLGSAVPCLLFITHNLFLCVLLWCAGCL